MKQTVDSHMMRWIIRDYFAGFRPAHVKEVMKWDSWFRIVYFGIFLPCLVGFAENGKTMLVYFLICAGIAFSMFSGMLHRIFLPKQMYLCPMDSRVRRNYVSKSAMFRIAFTTLFSAVCILILMAIGYCPWRMGLLLMFDGFIFSIFTCGMDERNWGNGRENHWSGKELANLILTIISSYGMVFVICWSTPVASWVIYIFLGIAVFIQLPLTIGYLRNWNQLVENASDYENSYQIGEQCKK